jgi:hypothetical protein
MTTPTLSHSSTRAFRRAARLLLLAGLLLTLLVALSACDTVDPGAEGAGDEEVISDVTMTLTSQGASQTVDAVFDEAGVLQQVDTIRLVPDASYLGDITLRNRFENEDITAEIEEEAEAHRFFFAVRDVSGVTASANDRESDYGPNAEGDDLPVGLQLQMTTTGTASGTGALRVVLGHYPNGGKQADDSVSDAPEIDVDVAFPIRFP